MQGCRVFTQNIVKAAPSKLVKVTRDSDVVHAVVIISGIANATGQEGEDNNRIMAETVAGG